MPVKVILGSLGFLFALKTSIFFGSFFDPREDPKRYEREILPADSIPVEFGEKVVVEESGLPAGSVLCLINLPFDTVAEQLKALLSGRMGISQHSQADLPQKGAGSKKEQGVRGEWPVFGENWTKLRDLGMNFANPREYEIRTQQYNTVDRISGFSWAEFRITDAKPLFGKESTFVAVRRIDHSREWTAISELRIPLPFKEEVENILVTDTEIQIIDTVIKERPDAGSKCFVPFPGYRGDDYWRNFVGELLGTAR